MSAKAEELRVPVRSHRGDFEFERRLYYIPLEPGNRRVLRLNPSGIPVRGIVYGLVGIAAMAAATQLPLLSALLGLVPWPVTTLLMPCVTAAFLAVVKPGGRAFHVAARALVGHLLGAKSLHAFRPCPPLGRAWRPPALLMLASGAEPVCRRLRFTGPGEFWIGRAHRQSRAAGWVTALPLRRAHLTLAEVDAERPTGTGLSRHLRAGKRVETRPA